MLRAGDLAAVVQPGREVEGVTFVLAHGKTGVGPVAVGVHAVGQQGGELRHPLTVIIGHADLALEEEDELTPKIREHLETILSASERMLGIASTMLQRSRSGFTPTQDRRSFDLVPMLAAVSEAFAASAREQRVTLETDLPAHLRMDGDVFRLRQVLDR